MPRLGILTFLTCILACVVGSRSGHAQSLDSGFAPALTPDAVVGSVAMQPDGKMIVAFGLGPNWPNDSTDFIRANEVSLVRLNVDGSLDPTFARVPHASTPYRRSATAVVLLTNGSALVAGDFYVPGASPHVGVVKVSSNGIVDETFRGSVGSGAIRRLLLQPDGKVLVSGFEQVASASGNRGIARLDSDGVADETFGATLSNTNGSVQVRAMCLQPDGRVLIAGDFTHVDSAWCGPVARLNTDGSHDASFEPVTFAGTPFIVGLTRQPDGKILVSGQFNLVNGQSRTNLVRLETTGAIDATFLAGATGDPGDVIYGTTALANGQILAFGVFDRFAGRSAGSIVRLQNNGDLDTTFDPGTLGPPNYGGITSATYDANGRLLVAAKFLEFNGITRHNIARFLSGAAPGTIQFVSTNIVTGEDEGARAELTVARLDGRAGPVAVTYATAGGNAIAGFDYLASTGLVVYADGEFKPKSFFVPILNDRLEEPDKFFNVLLSAPSNGVGLGNPSALQVRIPANDFAGSVDSAFLSGILAPPEPNCPVGCYSYSAVNALAVQSDGKILVGTLSQPLVSSGLSRLNVDGSLDTNFLSGVGVWGYVGAIAIQTDGKILVGGGFDSVNGVGITNLVRLNPDGSLDEGFACPRAGRSVESIRLQSDGKIVLGGYLNGLIEPYTLLARLNTNGSVDETFAGRLYDPSGDGEYNNHLAIDAQDRIYLVGDLQFAPFDLTRYGIARLTPNGALDPTFAPADSTNRVSREGILPLSDGTVLVWGGFKRIEGEPRNGLGRLNADGSLDRSFVPDLPTNSWVKNLALQSDGKMLLAGSFTGTFFNDTVRRLNKDGSIDSSFRSVMTTGLYDRVYAMVVQPDRGIVVGGQFESIGDLARHNLARLISDTQPALRVERIDQTSVRLLWSATLSSVVIESSSDFPPAWSELALSPTLSGNMFVVTNSTPRLQEFYRLRPR